MGKQTNVDVVTLAELLELKLTIPYYQRPYRWQAEKHVKQLLQDLFREKSKHNSHYRIGTVILHCAAENVFDIVDGQQRLVTLSMILYALGKNDIHTKLLNNEFDHTDSKNNLKYNYNYINSYLNNKSNDEKLSLIEFILNQCQVLKIELTELSEAFQLFDSQNARGKTLDPADLLKAYHLREMEGVYETEKYRIVNRWEEAIEKKKLNDVLGSYLFRLRSWKRNEWNYFFTKDDIEDFKGVTPSRMYRDGFHYPYLDKLSVDSSSVYYRYDQAIVNGKWFFTFVSHYTDLIDRIEEICESEEDGRLHYHGAWRVGDQRLIELYKNMLLVYLDKFGEDGNFEKYRILLFRWVFITRLDQPSIRFETIIKKLNNLDNPLVWISKWHYPELDIMIMKLKSIKEVSFDDNRNDFINENSIYNILQTIENLNESKL